MLVNTLMTDPGNNIFYSDGFRNVIEDHLSILKNLSNTQTVTIDPHKAYRYEGDFFSLLADYNVTQQLHWVTMRMNDLKSPIDFNGKIDSILVPDYAVIEQLRQSHTSARRIS